MPEKLTKPSKSTLEDLYVTKQMSLQVIGVLLGVSNTTVHNWLKSYNLERRTISEALTGKKLTKARADKARDNLLKIRTRRKGMKVSEEEKKRLGSIKPDRTGVLHTEETKNKMREAAAGRVISEECKKKMSETRLGNPKYSGPNHPLYGKQRPDITGEKHFSWNGGTTSLYRRIRQLTKYQEWRDFCFVRDDYTCQICNVRGSGNLQVDHIKPFALIVEENKIKTTYQAQECKEIWNTTNGRTLCEPCHKQTDTWGEGTKILLRAVTTRKDY